MTNVKPRSCSWVTSWHLKQFPSWCIIHLVFQVIAGDPKNPQAALLAAESICPGIFMTKLFFVICLAEVDLYRECPGSLILSHQFAYLATYPPTHPPISPSNYPSFHTYANLRIHPPIHPSTQLSTIYPLVSPSTQSYTNPSIHSSIYPSIQPLTYPLTHSFIFLLIYPSINTPTYIVTHSTIRSAIHSPTNPTHPIHLPANASIHTARQ